MAQVFSPILSIQINVSTILRVVVAASLHIKLVSGATVLQSVEHMQAVILIELE